MACTDGVSPDSLQLSEKVKQVSGLVDNECRAQDALGRIA